MTQQMIDPTPYIKLVDALNEVEALVKESAKTADGRMSLSGIVFHGSGSSFGTDLDMGAHYSIQYDSEAERWTLVSETDDAPDLCSFNQRVGEECRETDPCEQCWDMQARLADEQDRING
ncbi:hypothetical protein SEA_STUFF_80 [Streptomyces phage Stuff]|nr:hypothetical protein SEA_STUFF_80 [Streptomyces phage Stuff]